MIEFLLLIATVIVGYWLLCFALLILQVVFEIVKAVFEAIFVDPVRNRINKERLRNVIE